MGDFRIVIEALGGHGCQREKGDGETVIGCERTGCPDCMARELVRRLKRSGTTVKVAEIKHWPADMPGYTTERQVTDDLLTGVRTGAFPERERYVAQAKAVTPLTSTAGSTATHIFPATVFVPTTTGTTSVSGSPVTVNWNTTGTAPR